MSYLKHRQKNINCIHKLEINENPPLISYTHSAYQSAIIFSNAVAGKRVVEYELNESLEEWKTNEINGKVQKENTSIVYSDMKNELGYVIQYRALLENDSVTVKVNSQRKMCNWEVLDIALYEQEPTQENVIKAPQIRYGFSSLSKMFLEVNRELKPMLNTKRVLQYPFFLRMVRKNDKLVFEYSQNSKDWSKAYEAELPAKMSFIQMYVGVLVEIRNEFLNWKAQNHIQISSGHPYPNEIYVDYYLGPTKNFKPFVTNHYLDFYDELFEYSRNKSKWFRNIYEKIQSGIYIIADIDHFYIKETEYYKSIHRFHQVMIYGVNKKKKTYYILGYGEKNAMLQYEMSADALCKALSKEGIKFTCCRIDVNENPCAFDPVIIKRRLQDYLLMRRSDIDVTDVLPMMLSDNSGIDVYYSILNNMNDLYIFCHNPRISFFFYEHKRLMLERFEYIKTKVRTDDVRIGEIQISLEDNLKKSLIIKNLILMNAMKTNRKQLMIKVKAYIEEIIENEKKAYGMLCDVLDEFIKETR